MARKCFLNPKEYHQLIQLMSDYVNNIESNLHLESCGSHSSKVGRQELVAQRSRQINCDTIFCPVSN